MSSNIYYMTKRNPVLQAAEENNRFDSTSQIHALLNVLHPAITIALINDSARAHCKGLRLHGHWSVFIIHCRQQCRKNTIKKAAASSLVIDGSPSAKPTYLAAKIAPYKSQGRVSHLFRGYSGSLAFPGAHGARLRRKDGAHYNEQGLTPHHPSFYQENYRSSREREKEEGALNHDSKVTLSTGLTASLLLLL